MTVNQAVRSLRKHVKKTQQRFATELDISISSLNNYERRRIPEPKQLLAFLRAAQDAGRDDLVTVFHGALHEALGIAVSWYFGAGLRLLRLEPEDPAAWYEWAAVQALERCLTGATEYKEVAPVVISALALAIEKQAEIVNDPKIIERFAKE